MEEFDVRDDPLASSQKHPIISRDKIQAFNARGEGWGSGPYTAQKSFRTVHKTFFGYIHGASPHIMEMYGGVPSNFHVRGLRHSPLYGDTAYDLWNYFYRGICAFAMAAKAFGEDELFNSIRRYADDFTAACGRLSDTKP